MNQKNVFYISNINFVDGEDAIDKLDLSFIPAMSRRKLSKVDKLALSVMQSAYNGGDIEIVFASQYGELDRLNKIISQYQQDNEVSPITFGGSVHNSVAGQFSLLNKIYKAYNALASGENTFSIGLLESFMCAKKGEVLFCFADSYKEIIACAFLVSEVNRDGSLKLFLNTGNSALQPSKNEFYDFKRLIEGYSDSFVSNDSLFTVTRSI